MPGQTDFLVVKRKCREPVRKGTGIFNRLKASDIEADAQIVWIERDVIVNDVVVWLHIYLRAFAARMIALFNCLVISRGTMRADIWWNG